MNILPKKSWHVRNKDNIARVRRDEENARLEEEKLAKRAALAEQEARTKFLRDKVKNDTSSITSPVSTSLIECNEPQHINLFHNEEVGLGGTTTNAEYEAEKRAEQEKKEKALGVLKYLGQIKEDPKPWYLQKGKNEKEAPNSETCQDVDKKRKLDPLKMNAFLDQTKQSESAGKGKRNMEKKQLHKKLKPGKKTIAEMRKERLDREKSERLRAEELVKELKEGKLSNANDDPYKHKYHSQYNPQLARKPKWNKRHYPY